MQNHVFLIQAHKEPSLLRRILKRLSAQNHYFCLNIDKKAADYNDFANAFKDIPNIISVTRHNVMHGGFSQVECTLDQLKFAYDYKVKFDFYHTISGQDYPCVDADSFDDVFDRGGHQLYDAGL